MYFNTEYRVKELASFLSLNLGREKSAVSRRDDNKGYLFEFSCSNKQSDGLKWRSIPPLLKGGLCINLMIFFHLIIFIYLI